MYQLQPNTWDGKAGCIKRIADNTFIPPDPANTDYQEYLKWLAEGNAPIGADTPLPSGSVDDLTTNQGA